MENNELSNSKSAIMERLTAPMEEKDKIKTKEYIEKVYTEEEIIKLKTALNFPEVKYSTFVFFLSSSHEFLTSPLSEMPKHINDDPMDTWNSHIAKWSPTSGFSKKLPKTAFNGQNCRIRANTGNYDEVLCQRIRYHPGPESPVPERAEFSRVRGQRPGKGSWDPGPP